MSLFLGKIHYWLFNKILWFDNLENEIVELAKAENIDISQIQAHINAKYGEKLQNRNLEEIIDESNIHGWLQNKIHVSEGRMAAWTKFMIDNSPNNLAKIEEVYRLQGIKAAKEVKENKSEFDAKSMFNHLSDYLLDGMPCDRVNEVLVNEADEVKWAKRACVHKDVWSAEDMDVKVFYDLRNVWTKAFVNELDSSYEYNVADNDEYSITKK